MHAALAEDGLVTIPPGLATEIVEYHTLIPDLPDGARVWELSAGDGAFVRAILAANPALRVIALAPHPGQAGMLDGDARVTVITGTAEEFCAASPRPERFDAVVMTPPFTLGGRPPAWIGHVRAAWDLLAPGGRLVAVVPGEFADRRDEDHDALRELITLHGGYRQLPDTALTGSGPGARAVVIIADRPGVPV